MSSTPATRRRQLAFTLIVVAVGLGFVLIAGELMVRLVAPPLFDHPMRAYDPDVGWKARESTVFYRPITGGHGIRFASNGDGFRDVDHTRARTLPGPDGQRPIRRILVFGDSFTEAAQVEHHETWWSRLKERLNARQDEVYWEVQSFGVGDWGTAQQWLTYGKYGTLADLVILQVFPLNDIANNSLPAANIASSQDAYRPYFDPATNFKSLTSLNPRTTKLRRHSKLARFLIQIAIERRGPWGDERVFGSNQERFDYAGERSRSLGMPEEAKFPAVLYNTFAYKPEQYDLIRTGWDATDEALRRFATLAKSRRHQLLVLVVPHINQLPRRVGQGPKLPFTVHPTYAEQRIANVMAPYGVPTVPLVETFEERYETIAPYLEGHFNRPTHGLVAEVLEREVLALFPE